GNGREQAGEREYGEHLDPAGVALRNADVAKRHEQNQIERDVTEQGRQRDEMPPGTEQEDRARPELRECTTPASHRTALEGTADRRGHLSGLNAESARALIASKDQ